MYFLNCVCEKANEEYRNLLTGAPKPGKRLRCKLHVRLSNKHILRIDSLMFVVQPEHFKRLPSLKKHPIPDRFAHLFQIACTDTTVEHGPKSSATVDPDSCITMGECIQELGETGYELKLNEKGIVFLINNHDPYGLLESELIFVYDAFSFCVPTIYSTRQRRMTEGKAMPFVA